MAIVFIPPKMTEEMFDEIEKIVKEDIKGLKDVTNGLTEVFREYRKEKLKKKLKNK